MRRQSLYRLLRRERPHAVIAARGTVAAIAALQWRLLLKLECPYWASLGADTVQVGMVNGAFMLMAGGLSRPNP